jgi:hypothetical protein
MTAVEHPVIPDGLRAWQAAVVNLWSASEDAFATLVISWCSENIPGSLVCGDNGQENWSEEVKVAGVPSLQQALHKLWQRAHSHHELFKGMAFPDDFPDDAWLDQHEQQLVENLCDLLQDRHPVALRLSYHPDLGLSTRWVAILHDPEKNLPDSVLLNLSGEHLRELANPCLIQSKPTKTQTNDSYFAEAQMLCPFISPRYTSEGNKCLSTWI